MNILFVGGNFDEISEKDILNYSKGIVHYAANKFQWNIIDGLASREEVELEVLSAFTIGSYPRDYKQLFVSGKNTLYKGNIICEYTSFINLWGYKNISRKRSLIKKINQFSLSNKTEKTIIVYSVHTPFLQAAVYAKKLDPSIQISLVVPDLPEYMNLNEKQTLIYKKLKKLDINTFKKNLDYVDSFILLTEHMKTPMLVGNKPYIVVEGIVQNSESSNEKEFKRDEDRKRNIVYTGTLNEKFGVIKLIEAFLSIKNQDAQLILCGKGDTESKILEYAKKDKRIKYLGQVSNDEAVKIQKSATVLINPRQNIEEFTKYSFPSKNMEYLQTGVPLIAYKLDGIPDDYDEYIFYPKNNTTEELTNKIEEVLNLPINERIKFGKKAQKFVLEEKNIFKTTDKILNLLNESRLKNV